MVRTLFSVVIIIVCQIALGQTTVINVTDDIGYQYIGEHIEILTDTTGDLRLADVMEAASFERGKNPVPNLGLTASAHWIRFTLRNSSSHELLKLAVPNPEIESIQFTLIYPDGGMVRSDAGQKEDPRNYIERDVDPTFPIRIRRNEEVLVFLRIQSDKQLLLPITLSTPEVLSVQRSSRDTIIGLYMGVMLVLLLYNLFIYGSTRDRHYLIYVVYIAFVAMTQVVFSGFAKLHIWPGNSWLSINASVIFTVLTGLVANEFMIAFIHAREHAPRLAKARFFIYGLMGLGTLLYLSVRSHSGYQILQLAVMVSALYQFIMAVVIARKGSRQAYYFLAAWSVFLIGIILFVLKDIHILPYNTFTKYTMPLGTAIEGILLSLALADRINILRREKEQSQAESLRISKENERIIREQNVILEEKVQERTHALQESNEHLRLTQTQLVNAEKMASLGQLTAGIAHEINNPINFITSNIKPLRRNISEIVEVIQEYRALEPDNAIERIKELRSKDEQMGIQESIEELDDIINSIAEGSSRTAEIVRGLRNFSRLDESDLKESDINEGIRNTLTVLSPQYRDRVHMNTELGDIPKVECFPGKVNQVFMNVLTNAAQATLARSGDHDRIVNITSSVHEGHVIISITDNGIGMTNEVKARIFDPFFTTKAVGEGTGLGMAIVYGIIEDHHGSIRIDSTPGKGTEFRISLPISHVQLEQRRA